MEDAYVDVMLPNGTTKRAFKISGTGEVEDFRGASDAYVTLTEGNGTALLSVLFGTGAGGSSITADHIFESAAARDAYFGPPDPNLDELIIGTPIVVQLGTAQNPDVRVQVWSGENQPDAYPDPITNQWADAGQANLTTDQIQILSTLAGLTDGQIPQKSGTGFAASAMTEGTTEIVSTKAHRAPSFNANTGSLGLGSSKVSNAGIGLELTDAVLGRQCGIIAKVVGQDRPQEYLDGSEKTVDVQTENTISGPGDFNVTYTVTDETGRDGARVAAFVVIPEAAGDATFSIKKDDSSGPDLVTEVLVTFEAGDVGNETEVRLDADNAFRVEDGTVAFVEYTGPALRGALVNTAYFPFLRIKDRDYTTEEQARLSDFAKQRVGISANTVITAANLGTYNRKVIYSTATSEIALTISEGIDIDFFDVVVVANSSLRVVAQGAERINGETDVRFTEFEGGRVQKINGNYNIIFDNTDPDMTDDHVDEMDLSILGRQVSLRLGFTGSSLPDLTDSIDLPAEGAFITATNITVPAAVTGRVWIRNFAAGNNFIFDSDLADSIQFASDTTFPADSFFVVSNPESNSKTVDLSQVPTASFAGLVTGNTATVAAGTASLFFYDNGGVYLISNYNTAAGGATGDHPVVLTRDTPSLSDLADLAAASLNGNSALWVLASSQIQSTEDNVDPSIQIRALQAGLIDADGNDISTTAVNKSTVRLAGGSIVRIFSSTDLRVVTTPVSTPTQVPTYPDVPFSGVVEIEENQGTYNSYLERTATNAGGTTNQYIRMPDLHPSFRPSWVVPGDVFVMRHTGTSTGSQRPAFRVDNTGDQIAGNGFIYWCDPGATIAIQAPPLGIRTWQLFPVSQRSDGHTYFDGTQMMSDWYRDDADAVAANRSMRLHYNQVLVEGLVRDHVASQSSANNPVSLSFEHRNIQDDIAWINWFTTLGFAVPPLGTIVEEIKVNVPIALAWIESNVADNSQFQINDPTFIDSIQYITHQTGETLKIGLSVALPAHFGVSDVINISGNSFAGNNGDWAMTQIYPDRLAVDITIPGSSSSNNTGASGIAGRILYATNAIVADDLRVHNFNLYRNSARNNPITSFSTEWFDITTEPAPAGCILSIGYNTDIQTTGSRVAVQDDAGDFFGVLGGPRYPIGHVDNRTTPVTTGTALPVNQRVINIDSAQENLFYIPEMPSQMPEGETRRYEIVSVIGNNNGAVKVAVGSDEAANQVTLDEGFKEFTVIPYDSVGIELYNDGEINGAKLYKHLHRSVKSNIVYPSLTPLPSISFLLPFTAANIDPAKNQDPHGHLFDFSTANRVTVKAKGRYTFNASMRMYFVGTEPSGLLFASPVLTPYTTGNDALYEYAFSVPLFLARNGTAGTQPYITLLASFSFEADVDDWFEFEIQTGIPSGYSVSDFRIQNFTFDIQADIGG